MAEKISLKNLKSIPWFLAIYDPSSSVNLGFLTSKSIPDSVADSKEINFVETQVPGGKTTIKKFGSFGSRTINFSIRLASFNDNLGVVPQIAVLQSLRNPYESLQDITAHKDTAFQAPPKVIYYHTAATTVPLVCFCLSVDFTTSYPNILSRPQVVDVSMRLLVDESHPIMVAENIARKTLQLVGSVKSLTQTLTGGNNPYKKAGFF